MDFLVCHPVVKVSIVDGATGNLMEKSGETQEKEGNVDNLTVLQLLTGG